MSMAGIGYSMTMTGIGPIENVGMRLQVLVPDDRAQDTNVRD
jgi:hypothetical protein